MRVLKLGVILEMIVVGGMAKIPCLLMALFQLCSTIIVRCGDRKRREGRKVMPNVLVIRLPNHDNVQCEQGLTRENFKMQTTR
ncbi:hypothetical protein HA51_06020 [Pantoea rwandensis]|uniref:Uncharacterized protein n=1 Tax=Pantoea rwandensis TaxID=1076550 RepID=A0A1X1D2T0_9GAMM|nr:hypothetical protein HA51_06020 [Pantoea rwandensis]